MAKYRLNIDLDAKAKTELPKLQKKLGSATLIDVFRKALAVLEMIVDHQKAGGKVVLENKDGTREALRLI